VGTVSGPRLGEICGGAALVFDDGFGPGSDVQFAVDAVDVFANGVEADAHFFRDFFVAKAFGEQTIGKMRT